MLCCVCVVIVCVHRAFYSLRKCGIEADDVRMAVCVMRVVPARYAFVIHTKNPSNNDANEVRVGLDWGSELGSEHCLAGARAGFGCCQRVAVERVGARVHPCCLLIAVLEGSARCVSFRIPRSCTA